MAAKWGKCVILAICLAVSMVGCRTAQPNLKPPETPERLVSPPPGLFDSPEYPKLAFDAQQDPYRRQLDMKAMGQAGGRGSMMPASGMGGMGPGR
jgi:hypothetical protein